MPPKQAIIHRRGFAAILLCLLMGLTQPVLTQESEEPLAEPPEDERQTILETLRAVLDVQENLKLEIKELSGQIKQTASKEQKGQLNAELAKLEQQLSDTRDNFEKVATGIDTTVGRAEIGKFKLEEDLLSLLEPLVKEMKGMTARMREKSRLKEQVAHYSEALPRSSRAVTSLGQLLPQTKDPVVKARLEKLNEKWQNQIVRISSGLRAAKLQLEKMEREEASFTESSQTFFKAFYKKRGRDLLKAFAVLLIILMVTSLIHRLMKRTLPGYRARHRPFRIRLLDLTYRSLTVLLLIGGPMMVFYLAEDWVLFSLGVIILLGIGWAIRHTVPRMWKQAQLVLNIGSVREGERILYLGLPWRVKQINLFSVLENPVADLELRIPINQLVGIDSRPCREDEPWFPCRKDDWVILSDGQRGQVTGLSHELVELTERGGARITYLMEKFLALTPKNLSGTFRIKESFGLSYNLQAETTSSVLRTLEERLRARLAEQEFAEQLLMLRVEFQQAGSSSLDVVVIADFDGEAAPLYNRIRRALQGWCVDVCTQHGWEIPFPQLTLHTHTQASS